MAMSTRPKASRPRRGRRSAHTSGNWSRKRDTFHLCAHSRQNPRAHSCADSSRVRSYAALRPDPSKAACHSHLAIILEYLASPPPLLPREHVPN